jgi:antitoxin component of MazEF toxin-antitoxin module
LRVWGGSYHDYWFADDAILKVRLVPQIITIIGIIVLVALTLIFSVSGVVVGAVFAVATYLASGRLAKSRRSRMALLTVQQAQQKGLVTLRIPYSVVSQAELKGRRLTLSVEGRKIRVNIPQQYLADVQSLLSSKLPGDFVSDG